MNVEYATPEDDAEYWVVAKNVAGEAKSTAQLIVQSKELGTYQGNLRVIYNELTDIIF